MNKDTAAYKKLARFIEDKFDIETLMEIGMLGKEIGRYDYEKIAARICQFFDLKGIYNYKHICEGRRCDGECDDPSEYCKSFQPEWNEVKIDQAEMLSQDRWLN